MQPGFYTLQTELIVQLRGSDVEARLQNASLGLLTQAPVSDGTGVFEPTYEGYARLPLTLVPASVNTPNGTLYNADKLSFAIDDGMGEINHAGIFDGDDLLAYGRLQKSTTYTTEPEVVFLATEIGLKRNHLVWNSNTGFKSKEQVEREDAERAAHLAGR